MRHLKSGRKLKRTNSHRSALMRNLATSLIISEKKSIATTEAKAKELRPYIEKLITRAKNAKKREIQGLLPEGQTMDVHSRRIASTYLYSKAAVQELFEEIAVRVADRPGGYTRIIKTGFRRGDSAQTAVIHLVDWHAEIETSNARKKRRPAAPRPKVKTQTETKDSTQKTSSSKETTKPTEPEVLEVSENQEVIAQTSPIAESTQAPGDVPTVEGTNDIASSQEETSDLPIENIDEEEPQIKIKKIEE
ncbi:MAG: 50S ribosomal protein L17 [Chloroherpetonaceae bacterium]|nr:50S ribosomal protein L17 [bacterium]